MFEGKTILVVDDEESIVELIRYNLEQAGFKVMVAYDGPEALAAVESCEPDLVVLDRMLPGADGLDICRYMRDNGCNIPVLMLTARTQEVDQILGLELGADDYMTKPFSPRVLVARVRALLRRSTRKVPAQEASVYHVGDLIVDIGRHEVTYCGKMVELTAKEFDILALLVSQPGRVFTRDQVIAAVWNYDFSGETRIVDVHISNLRDKLEAKSGGQRMIETVRGVGYKLAAN